MATVEYDTRVDAMITSVAGDDGDGQRPPVWETIVTADGRHRVEDRARASFDAHCFVGELVTLHLSERGRVFMVSRRGPRAAWKNGE